MSKRTREEAKLHDTDRGQETQKKSRAERHLDQVQQQNVQLTETVHQLSSTLGVQLKYFLFFFILSH